MLIATVSPADSSGSVTFFLNGNPYVGPGAVVGLLGDQTEWRTRNVGEQQRRATRRDHPAMDLGNLQLRVYARVDGDDVVVTTQLLDERSKIGKAHSASALGP